MPRFDRPRATRDFLPPETAVRNHVQEQFAGVAESFGFQAVQTPMFEKAELFLAQSGTEIKSALLTFHSDHEEYALRPEMTAPVCRLVGSGALEGSAGHQKLYYIAPCFRYCRPQPGRYREFTQAGIECMGAAGPAFDAEVIAVACRILRRLGISSHALKIGNIGVFRDLLPPQLEPGDRARVIGHLDRLISIDDKCRLLSKTLSKTDDTGLIEDLNLDRMELAALQQQVDYSGPQVIEQRPRLSAGEYAELLPQEAEATFRRVWSVENLIPHDTADLLLRVSRLRGSLAEVHQEARAILEGTPAVGALEELVSVCRHLEMYELGDFEAVLGIARGFTFYTSTVFEISSEAGEGGRKYCGGGRYDGLVEEFGGPPLPSTGCAFRFDTLVDAFLAENDWSAPRPYQLYLLAERDEILPRVIAQAESLRGRGLRVGVEVGPQTPPTPEDCDARRSDWIALVGADQLNNNTLRISDGSHLEEISADAESVAMRIEQAGD